MRELGVRQRPAGRSSLGSSAGIYKQYPISQKQHAKSCAASSRRVASDQRTTGIPTQLANRVTRCSTYLHRSRTSSQCSAMVARLCEKEDTREGTRECGAVLLCLGHERRPVLPGELRVSRMRTAAKASFFSFELEADLRDFFSSGRSSTWVGANCPCTLATRYEVPSQGRPEERCVCVCVCLYCHSPRLPQQLVGRR